MRHLTIAMDWDGTAAEDPTTFLRVAQIFKAAGHTVVICTQRAAEYGAEIEAVVGTALPIIYASGFAKRQVASFCGYHVDVWMDDNPTAVDTAFVYQPPRDIGESSTPSPLR
jgi:phosphoglycolate phosphatase-like HAD superfamily hydrolase